jgi:hypothetical protein
MPGKSIVSSSGFGCVDLYLIDGIPFRKWNSLLQGEVEWFESRSDSRITNIKKVVELAQKISKEQGIPENDALERVQDLENEENRHLLLKYAPQLDEIKATNYTEAQFKKDIFVLIANNRIPKKWIRENYQIFSDNYEIEFTGDPHFTGEIALKLPTSLINQVAEFCSYEKIEWKEPVEATEPEEEKTLGE